MSLSSLHGDALDAFCGSRNFRNYRCSFIPWFSGSLSLFVLSHCIRFNFLSLNLFSKVLLQPGPRSSAAGLKIITTMKLKKKYSGRCM